MSLRLLPVTVATLFIVALQLSLLSSLRVGGVVIMLVWLWPLCLGLSGVTGSALWSATVAGVFFDTHAVTPFGVTAAVGLTLAYGASRLGKEGVGDLDSAAWWVTPLLAALGGLLAPLLYVAIGFLGLNFSLWRDSVLVMSGVNALAFAVAARPLTRLARWATGSVRVAR